MGRVKELIGDDSIEIKLKNKSIWRINECYAEEYSKGNVFCLGDAAHRHPPHNGPGSNTCIQDAFNLAWKMAYVLKNRADPSLLSTYNEERQPIGKYIVGRANDTARLHLTLYKTLGLLDPDSERKRQIHAQFEEDSPEGEERRNAFRKAIRDLEEERHGLGGEMNQRYRSSAVYRDDETAEPPLSATEHEKNTPPYREHVPGFPSSARLAGCTDQTGRAEGPNDLNQRPRQARQVHAPDRHRRRKAVGICRRASRRGDGRAGRGVQYRLGPRLRGYVLQLVRQAPGRGEGGRLRAAGSGVARSCRLAMTERPVGTR